MNGWQLTSDYEMLNLDTQKVLTSGQLDIITPMIHQLNWTVVKVEFKDLQPGNYQLTYKNIRGGLLSYIDMCPGK
jgi:hypothetical protein